MESGSGRLAIPDQFMEQAPGPRGSPHRPHPTGSDRWGVALAPPVCAANAESRRSSVVAPQEGQARGASPRTSSSHRAPHCPQSYS
jgi:hypothetical protein